MCQKECTFDIALAACQLAIENRASETASKYIILNLAKLFVVFLLYHRGLAETAKRWHADPREYGKAVSLHGSYILLVDSGNAYVIAVNLLLSPEIADLNAAAMLADSLNANTLAIESSRAIHACLWRAAGNFFENKDILI